MKDGEGRIIYVGKSRKLKARVSQYFRDGEKNHKTEKMVAAVRDFETIFVTNEAEALTLENELIKLHMPRFNIKLKDSKAYPYIKVTVAEQYPRVVYTRDRKDDGARYFGPFPDQSAARSLLATVCRIIGVPDCKRSFPRDIGASRPCIYRDMHRCVAPCAGDVTPEEYGTVINEALAFLSGNTASVRRLLTERMKRAAEEERFEAAAACRDSIASLDRLRERQKVVGRPGTELDIIAAEHGELCSCATVFSVRDGVLVSKEDFLFTGDEIIDADALTSFAGGYYTERGYVPPLVLLETESAEGDAAVCSEFLSSLSGRKVNVAVPRRGEKRELCLMAKKNAAEKLHAAETAAQTVSVAAVRLAQLLCLEVVPERIEAYDISNYGNEQIRAAMIVYEKGSFVKRDYRIFRFPDGKQDDYACMHDAVLRRFSHENTDKSTMPRLPDLVLVDGGAGQVAAARAALLECGIPELPVFGMVKDEHHKTRALTGGDGDIGIARETAVFRMIYALQEEVHRFAVSRTSAGKRKTLHRSSLEDIPGVGAVKAKRLLSYFGGLEAIKRAEISELAACRVGITAAAAIRQYFHPEDEDGGQSTDGIRNKTVKNEGKGKKKQ